MSTPSRKYLAQLVTARSADVRRVAVPSEAFEGGERDIYRAVRAVANDADLVTMEAVIAHLREVGRLEAAGGYDGVDSLSDYIGANTLEGARVALVTSASQRLLMAASKASHEAARDGRSRDATEAMQSALRDLTVLPNKIESALRSLISNIPKDAGLRKTILWLGNEVFSSAKETAAARSIVDVAAAQSLGATNAPLSSAKPVNYKFARKSSKQKHSEHA